MYAGEHAWGGARPSQITYWITSMGLGLELPAGAPPGYKVGKDSFCTLAHGQLGVLFVFIWRRAWLLGESPPTGAQTYTGDRTRMGATVRPA